MSLHLCRLSEAPNLWDQAVAFKYIEVCVDTFLAFLVWNMPSIHAVVCSSRQPDPIDP